MSVIGRIPPGQGPADSTQQAGAPDRDVGDGLAPQGVAPFAIPTSVTRPLRNAAVLFLLFLAGVIAWSGLAPLSTTVRIPGKLVATEVSRKVQPLSGGRIARVNARLHQQIRAGDVLFRFDVDKEDLRARAIKARLAGRRQELARLDFVLAAVARDPGAGATAPGHSESAHGVARPVTWRAGEGTVPPGDPVTERAGHRDGEPDRFLARLNTVRARLHLLERRRASAAVRLATLAKELSARRAARVLLLRAVRRAQKLERDGAMTTARLDELRGQLLGADASVASLAGRQAELVGQRAALEAQKSQIVQELKLQLTQDRKTIVDDIDRLSEELATLALTIDRATVRAPVSGMISALPADAPGLVVRPAEVLAVISRPGSQIDVAMNVPSGQIDQIYAGQSGLVALSSLPQRRLPPVRLDVTGVSRDPADDPSARGSYYLARGHIKTNDLRAARRALGHDLHLAPGMPVTVSLSGPQTTLLSYVLAPLTAVWGNAFEE